MAKGLSIATNYHNTIAAINDFNALGRFAADCGCRDLVEKHLPPPKASWRTIDKHLAKLREELTARGFNPPPNPSLGASDAERNEK